MMQQITESITLKEIQHTYDESRNVIPCVRLSFGHGLVGNSRSNIILISLFLHPLPTRRYSAIYYFHLGNPGVFKKSIVGNQQLA